jgi:hypothetical protein
MKTKLVKCPTCGKMVEWSTENKWRPFCSERCRIIDLGEWAAERHRIPSETPEEFDEGEGREKSEE